MHESVSLPFTICFLIQESNVLLIKRIKKPWINHWNGVGGKLREGESPLSCIIRETREETGIDLTKAKKTMFTGIVTWQGAAGKVGMYAYISFLSPQQLLWSGEKKTAEGNLAWKRLSWVLDKNNKTVARNVPHFLRPMLEKTQPVEYFCHFDGNGKLIDVTVSALPKHLTIS